LLWVKLISMPGRLHLLKKPLSIIVLTLTSTIVCAGPPQQKPVYDQDLRPFGFAVESHGQIIGNFTDLNFLTDDLILVTINNRVYGPVEKTFSDQPISKLLLFDISQHRLVKSAEMPVEKDRHSVRALEDGRFVLLNETGVRVCSRELECGSPRLTGGPLFVSPAGTKIVVGGNGRTEQVLLDGVTLEELARYPWNNPQVIPGDRGLLVVRDRKVYVRVAGQTDRELPLEGAGIWPTARFINHDTVADFESDTSLAVTKLDGTIAFRIPVRARWHVSEVVTSASGLRFCFHEAGYTQFNSLVNFLDIDSGRPLNFESVDVRSTGSGVSLFELRWDPRPYVGIPITPALSPDGRKIAVVRQGFLEIFEIP
jgi:hypothetical protein